MLDMTTALSTPAVGVVLDSWRWQRPDGSVAYVQKLADGKGGWFLKSSSQP